MYPFSGTLIAPFDFRKLLSSFFNFNGTNNQEQVSTTTAASSTTVSTTTRTTTDVSYDNVTPNDKIEQDEPPKISDLARLGNNSTKVLDLQENEVNPQASDSTTSRSIKD